MSIANELITRGWTHGGTVDDDGHVCLVGAAAAAYGTLCLGTHDSWVSLPLNVKQALMEAVGWNPAGDTHRGACIVAAFNDVHGEEAALRAAKHTDEILDAL